MIQMDPGSGMLPGFPFCPPAHRLTQRGDVYETDDLHPGRRPAAGLSGPAAAGGWMARNDLGPGEGRWKRRRAAGPGSGRRTAAAAHAGMPERDAPPSAHGHGAGSGAPVGPAAVRPAAAGRHDRRSEPTPDGGLWADASGLLRPGGDPGRQRRAHGGGGGTHPQKPCGAAVLLAPFTGVRRG